MRAAALCFIAQIGLAVFGLPSALMGWMRCANVARPEGAPRRIVILGGSGMPSPTTLSRAYYGAQCALAHPRAACIVALPAVGNPDDEAVGRLREELVLRGVSGKRVRLETEGRNTHAQAVNIARMVGRAGRVEPVVLVTSPYHMRRAYLCFRKAGFEKLIVLPALSTGSESDYRRAQAAWSGFDPRGLLGHMRYGFWSTLTAEVWIARELCGLAIYKLRGWI
jgi:uncharacterized SAM-binding protein YcdF (DUF218 family)